MNEVLEKAKDLGRSVATAIINPFLPKNHHRVTWQAYGKWRTFTHSDGRVFFRRYKQLPKGAKVVRNAREARGQARALWGLELDSKGRLPVVFPTPTPNRVPLISERCYPFGRPRSVRITPQRPSITRPFRGLGR